LFHSLFSIGLVFGWIAALLFKHLHILLQIVDLNIFDLFFDSIDSSFHVSNFIIVV
jgi:hypothetical protein